MHFWEKRDISNIVYACHKVYFQMWREVRFDWWWPWDVKIYLVPKYLRRIVYLLLHNNIYVKFGLIRYHKQWKTKLGNVHIKYVIVVGFLTLSFRMQGSQPAWKSWKNCKKSFYFFQSWKNQAIWEMLQIREYDWPTKQSGQSVICCIMWTEFTGQVAF